jgi:hypothetical protein
LQQCSCVSGSLPWKPTIDCLKDILGQIKLLSFRVLLCRVSNGARICLSVSCVQCYKCLSFCVLCQMLHVSIFLCLVSNVTRICLSVSCVQCYPCLSFCILCSFVTFDTKHRKTNTGNIGHKTQKDRHGQHWTQDTER